LDFANATRQNENFLIGLSTRAMLSIITAGKASAFMSGRDYVIPEDILDYMKYTVTHRVVLKNNIHENEKAEIVKSLLESVPLHA